MMDQRDFKCFTKWTLCFSCYICALYSLTRFWKSEEAFFSDSFLIPHGFLSYLAAGCKVNRIIYCMQESF